MKNMIKALLSMYSLRYPTVITYMLQSTEYRVMPYLSWLNRTRNFNTVMRRRVLEPTNAARTLLRAVRLGIAAELLIGIALICLGAIHKVVGGVYFGLAIIVIYPLVWPYLIALLLLFGRWFIVLPQERQLIAASEKLFAAHKGIRIAVAGSYGKTTMKELLATVLSEGKHVRATPANKNVAISHASFARTISDAAIVIIEYGEGKPGDVARFARTTHPTHAVITGLAPAHLDRYKTVAAAGADIFAVADYLGGKHVYVDESSTSIKSFLKKSYNVFNEEGALDWSVHHASVSLTGTTFTMRKGTQTMQLHSQLIGRHHLSFLCFVAAFGLEMGLTKAQVQTGIAKTKPFEHRMQPYPLSGAWIIDDTYNGNLEGIRVGTQLLSELPAKRKIYVTPGLVDQGKEAARVHTEMGSLIARSGANLVVLMDNSATVSIRAGLTTAKYSGEVMVASNPLEFYTNLKHFVAAGDLVLMQNDWTDNYA
jgi:UDP-N-acetylmuramoyl-tripeptide--D-alanyl-D-alanine ligase